MRVAEGLGRNNNIGTLGGYVLSDVRIVSGKMCDVIVYNDNSV